MLGTKKDKSKMDTCLKCIHSSCNGNQSNKCSKEDLVCGVVNKNVSQMISGNESCPRGYWNHVTYPKPGCGCSS